MNAAATRRPPRTVTFEAEWRRVSRLLGLCGFGAVAWTGELNPLTIFAFAGMWLAAWFVGPPRFWRPWMSTVVVLLASGAIGMMALRETFAGVLYLLCLLAACKGFALDTPRDHLHVVIVSFLMLLASSVIMVSAVYILFVLAYLTLLVADLSMMSRARDSSRGEGGSWRTRPAPGRALRGAFGTACGVLVLAGALFYVIPHTQERGLRPGTWNPGPETATSGFTGDLDVRPVDHITPDDTVTMNVYAHWDRGHTGPLPETLRLRGAVLDYFDNQRWTRSYQLGGSVQMDQEREVLVRKRRGGELVLVQQIDQELNNVRSLFGAPEVLRYRFAPGVLPRMRLDARSGLLWLSPGSAAESATKRLVYTVWSALAPEGVDSAPDSQSAAPAPVPLSEEEVARYTQLPSRSMERIREISDERLAGIEEPREKVEALLKWFNRDFTYSLSPGGRRGMNPIVGFLTETQKGHCELFASSLALLLRSQGVPVRIVTGYYCSVGGPALNSYAVRRSDAHAWTEVWFADSGWTVIDPTPPDHRGRASYGSSLEIFWVQQVSSVRTTWRKFVLNYNQTTQGEMIQTVLEMPAMRALRGFASEGGEELAGKARAWFDLTDKLGAWGREHSDAAAALSVMLPLGAVALTLAGLWRLLGRRRHARALARLERSSVAFMNVMLERLKRQGVTRETSQTPAELLAGARSPLTAEQAAWLAELYQRIRFGGHRPSRDELNEALRMARGVA